MKKIENITLIGMPGSGKSTVGRRLAEQWSWNFLDTDEFIEQQNGKKLETIIAAIGPAEFLKLEARLVQSLAVHRTVIATGGSVIYDEKTMAHLREMSTVVYLEVPLADIEARVGDLTARGVIIAPGMSVAGLWHERDPLYRRFAHVIIPSQGDDAAKSMVDLLQGLQPLLDYHPPM